jgi:hypothetical protein
MSLSRPINGGRVGSGNVSGGGPVPWRGIACGAAVPAALAGVVPASFAKAVPASFADVGLGPFAGVGLASLVGAVLGPLVGAVLGSVAGVGLASVVGAVFGSVASDADAAGRLECRDDCGPGLWPGPRPRAGSEPVRGFGARLGVTRAAEALP